MISLCAIIAKWIDASRKKAEKAFHFKGDVSMNRFARGRVKRFERSNGLDTALY